MRLSLDYQQFEVRRRQGAKSKCNDWVNQEATPNCKGRSSLVLGYYNGVSKLLHLERGCRQLAEPRQ